MVHLTHQNIAHQASCNTSQQNGVGGVAGKSLATLVIADLGRRRFSTSLPGQEAPHPAAAAAVAQQQQIFSAHLEAAEAGVNSAGKIVQMLFR